MKINTLVTGGSGFFGSFLVKKLVSQSYNVSIFDLNAEYINDNIKAVRGDIRNKDDLEKSLDNIDIVYHNVAQVPLANNKKLLWEVNFLGTRNLLELCQKRNVKKIIFTSTSAIYGVPPSNPVTELTRALPLEEYGKAKLASENLCKQYSQEYNLDITIIRPRTILGAGRLGIFEFLFDWIKNNQPVPVFDGGKNIYQFVHANDLADVCILSAQRKGYNEYNVGSDKFGSMFDLIYNLIKKVNSKSRIVSLPMHLFEKIMNFTSKIGASPFSPYHSLMYGRSLYFDISKIKKELNFNPRYSSDQAILESYNNFLLDQDFNQGSLHQRKISKKRLARIIPYLLKLL
jgi:nucleoside-diphosphate-sugar epimerase